MNERISINPISMFLLKLTTFSFSILISMLIYEFSSTRGFVYNIYSNFWQNNPTLLNFVSEIEWLKEIFLKLYVNALNLPDYLVLTCMVLPIFFIMKHKVNTKFSSPDFFTRQVIPSGNHKKTKQTKNTQPSLFELIKRKTNTPAIAIISSTDSKIPSGKDIKKKESSNPSPSAHPPKRKPKKQPSETPSLNLNLSSSHMHQGFEFYIRKTVLPEKLQNIFTILLEFSDEIYCGGSSIIDLLRNKSLPEDADLDFFGFNIDTSLLFSKKFRSTNNKNLFIYDDLEKGLKFELYVQNDLKGLNKKDRLKEALEKRDSTVSSFGCDQVGAVHILKESYYTKDLLGNRLKTIQDSTVCFNEDPVRLLRAIKYIEKGFNPTPEFDTALRNWTGSPSIIETIRLHATMSRMLKNENKRENYINLLKKYGLIEKLFFVSTYNKKNQEIYQQLLIRLATTKPNYYKTSVAPQEQFIEHAPTYN